MKLEEAKNIIKESVIDTQQAVKKLMEVQFEIFYNDFKRQLEEKQSQYDALNEQRNDLMKAKNFEDLQRMVKNINNHGDTKDYWGWLIFLNKLGGLEIAPLFFWLCSVCTCT